MSTKISMIIYIFSCGSCSFSDSTDCFNQYYLNEDTSFPDALEVTKLSLSDLITTMVLAPKTRADVNLNCSFEMSVMDYSNLCWIDFVTPTVVDLKARKVNYSSLFLFDY